MFKKNNIPGQVPVFIVEFYRQLNKGVAIYHQDLMKNYKIIDSIIDSKPVIFTTDRKFVKTVLVKDFNFFSNRKVIL